MDLFSRERAITHLMHVCRRLPFEQFTTDLFSRERELTHLTHPPSGFPGAGVPSLSERALLSPPHGSRGGRAVLLVPPPRCGHGGPVPLLPRAHGGRVVLLGRLCGPCWGPAQVGMEGVWLHGGLAQVGVGWCGVALVWGWLRWAWHGEGVSCHVMGCLHVMGL